MSFKVRNVNRSKVACHADGKTYTVNGWIVAPAGWVGGDGSPQAVTLYLHGLGFGEFFWDFKAVPGYDYAAAQARAGLVSVVVDRLGYDRSGKSYRKDICLGSRADIAHQMVMDLRSGHYQVASRPQAPRFSQVVLAGHSFGGLISQIEAYSFGDIDGLVVVAYSDTVVSPLAKAAARRAGEEVCRRRVDGYGPGGYAPFAPKPVAPEALFADVDPQVLKAALARLNIDPCGDNASAAAAVKAELANLHRVHVQVLIVTSGADALFPAAGRRPAGRALHRQPVRHDPYHRRRRSRHHPAAQPRVASSRSSGKNRRVSTPAAITRRPVPAGRPGGVTLPVVVAGGAVLRPAQRPRSRAARR